MDDPTQIPWAEHQAWERQWWGTCANTFAEENKQIVYAHRMGMVNAPPPGLPELWPAYDLGGRSVLDVGGGPTSLLLKTWNRHSRCVVADPCVYPTWTQQRYEHVGLQTSHCPGERLSTMLDPGFDEAWIYNVLQHTSDPEAIALEMRKLATGVRVFEWIDTPPEMGHPQTLTAEALSDWFGIRGTVEQMDGSNGCGGRAWYGTSA